MRTPITGILDSSLCRLANEPCDYFHISYLSFFPKVTRGLNKLSGFADSSKQLRNYVKDMKPDWFEKELPNLRPCLFRV